MTKRTGLYAVLMLLGTLVLAAVTAIAGSMPVGSLLGSKNATLDGQTPLPHTTMLSGDNLHVNNDGLAILTLGPGNRMVLGHGTDASFAEGAGGTTVALNRGSLALYHHPSSTGFRIKADNVTVIPAQGYKTLGEVAMVNGLVVVTAKDGTLRVERNGAAQEVSKGKTITLATTAARAPAPVPPGDRHLKHITAATPLIVTAVIGASAAAVLATVALVRTNKGLCQTGVVGNSSGAASPSTPSSSCP